MPTVPPSENAAPPLPTTPPAEPAPEPSASASAASPPTEPRGPGHELDTFYAALRELSQHTRKRHVRAVWLGDSHGAADIWTAPLRAKLQAQFGDGGIGFVHVGYKANSRHEGMRIEIKGRWSVEPRGPSTPVHTGDGTFGLGGVITSGSSDDPRALLTVTDKDLPPTLLWDFCYKPSTPRDEISLSVSGLPDRTLRADADGGHASPPGVLHHIAFTTTVPSPVLRTFPVGGEPGFCGVTIETDPSTQPGVILDTLGINGARLVTPLAWDEAAWVKELSRRPPDLAILEYGTNESGDHVIHPEAYVENLRKLMARIRTASPGCDCLVLAPTDRADTEDRSPLVRDALRDAARASGCGFWDTYEQMGGKGSIVAWRDKTPPLAGRDGVHLTVRGYQLLGEKLAASVMEKYRP